MAAGDQRKQKNRESSLGQSPMQMDRRYGPSENAAASNDARCLFWHHPGLRVPLKFNHILSADKKVQRSPVGKKMGDGIDRNACSHICVREQAPGKPEPQCSSYRLSARAT